MSRGDDTEMWEKRKRLIIFLFRRYGYRDTMRIMDSCGFNAGKREYVYRLGIWGIRKNKGPKNKSSAKNAASRVRRPFFDLEELHLCLFAPGALVSYKEQVESMRHGEQDIGLLFCYARAVETEEQARVLAEYIWCCIQRLGDNREVCSFLHILRGYTLCHAGYSTPEVKSAVEESVRFLKNGCFTDEAPSQGRTQYVIDIPRLVLFRYGLGDDQDLWKNLLGFHIPRLAPSESPVACESILKDVFAWCLKKLGSDAARDFSADILDVPCGGVDGGSARKATAHVFCFLLTQYLAEPDITDPFSRVVNQNLQISVCDLLYTLAALILAGVSPSQRLSFENLCASPGDLMTAAWRRAEALLPAGKSAGQPACQCLLVFFLDTYASLTPPTARSSQERQFMGDVCKRAEKLVLSAEGDQAGGLELLEESMFLGDAEELTDEDGL